MGDYPIKPVVAILVYFLLLTFVVTLFTNISTDFNLDTGITSTGGIDTTQSQQFVEYADNPRFEGIRYDEIKMPRYALERNIQPTPMIASGLIYDETTCLSYNGFEWGVTNWIISWIPGISDSFGCIGTLNITHYVGDPIPVNYSFQDGGGVCGMPNVVNDREVAESLGCTWYSIDLQQQLQQEEILDEQNFNSIWGGVKQIVTFNIDFDLSDTKPFLAFIINFLLIGLPVIVISTYIIIIFRKLVGFT